MGTSARLHNMEPAEDLQKIAAGETKQVADTFRAADNFSTTPIVTESQRKTGEVASASEKIRSTSVAGYPNGAK